jgi:TolB-like protein/Tfp pilus assembly protein PilF
MENPESEEFCIECGTKLEAEHAPTPRPAEPPQQQVPESVAEPPAVPEPEPEAPPEPPAAQPLFGERYKVIENLGSGRLGTVYRVFDKALERDLALRALKPEFAQNSQAFEGFSRELRTERAIVHKNISRLFELSVEKGTPYLTMELVQGQDLKTLLREKSPFPPDKILSLGRQLAEGLAELHRRNLLCRNLEPAHILVDKEGTPKIMDVGIIQWLRDKGFTGEGVTSAAPEYLSPEQVENRTIDQRSDIYSLGIILYEMAIGSPPFRGETPEEIGQKHLQENPGNPRELSRRIPPELSLLILRCLEKDPEKRYQTAKEVSSDLEKIEDTLAGIVAAAPEAPAGPAAVRAEGEVKPAPLEIRPERRPAPRPERKKSAIRRPVVPTRYFVVAAAAVGVVAVLILLWQLVLRPSGRGTPAPPASDKISLAVVPFEDLSAAKDRAPVGEAMAEALISAFSHISGLRVSAPLTSFSFRGLPTASREIGQRLGANYLLTGGYEFGDRSLRVTAQLVKTVDGTTVWSNQFDRIPEDLFGLQEEIARGPIAALKLKLPADKDAVLVTRYTTNPEAFDLYSQGRSQAGRGGKDGLERSIELFKKAAEKDPGYALAYAGLAKAYISLGSDSLWPPKKAFPGARPAILKALELAPDLAAAHLSLAILKWKSERDLAGAEREFKEASIRGPRDPEVGYFRALFLSTLGRHEEAIAQMRSAQALDPFAPKLSFGLGAVLYYARLYEQAATELKQGLEKAPGYAANYDYLGLVDIQIAQFIEAVQMFGQAAARGGSPIETGLHAAIALSRLGRRQEVGKILDEALSPSAENYVSSVSIAAVYAALMEKEQVQACLEKAVADGDPSLVFLKVYPLFDPVRHELWFSELLRKIGLEKTL